MTKYTGEIEAKEQKTTKTNTQYVCFVIDGKRWNCFDAITNKEFNIGDFVEFETEKKGEFENLIPETMKIINAPEAIPGGSAGSIPAVQECIHKNINENPDSLEIGTPSKGGAIKVYGDFSRPNDFLDKIHKAKNIRDEANKLFNPILE